METIQTDAKKEFETKVRKKNKKQSTYFFIRLGIAFFLLLSFSIYLLSPVSSISNMTLVGNVYFTNEDIYKIINKNKKSSLFSINEHNVNEMLIAHPLIKKARTEVGLLGVNISIIENAISYQYEQRYYMVYGENYSQAEIDDNLIIDDYISSHMIDITNLPLIINNPAQIDRDYLSTYANITSLTTRINHTIKFIEPSADKKSFIFYIKVDGNINYLRVKLFYDKQFETMDYARCLSDDNEAITCFYREIEKHHSYEVHEALIAGNNISYYSTKMSLSKVDNKIVPTFIGDL